MVVEGGCSFSFKEGCWSSSVDVACSTKQNPAEAPGKQNPRWRREVTKRIGSVRFWFASQSRQRTMQDDYLFLFSASLLSSLCG